MIALLTLITEDSSPVGLANALPGASVAVAVLAARVDHALGAEGALPPWTTPGREGQREKERGIA